MKLRAAIWSALALFLLGNVALMGLYVAARSSAGPAESDALPVIKEVPSFTLTNTRNEEFSSDSLLGDVWVADFIFTSCPGPCPIMTKNMANVAETLRMYSDVKFVSITVDPETDTPDVLRRYGDRHAADPERWHFLTGALDSIKSIAAEGFLVGSIDDPMIHSPKFCLVDRQGRIRGYYTGTEEEEIDRLIADIHQLRKEKV